MSMNASATPERSAGNHLLPRRHRRRGCAGTRAQGEEDRGEAWDARRRNGRACEPEADEAMGAGVEKIGGTANGRKRRLNDSCRLVQETSARASSHQRFAVVSRNVLLQEPANAYTNANANGDTAATRGTRRSRWAHAVLVINAQTGTFEAVVEIPENPEQNGTPHSVQTVLDEHDVAHVQDAGDAMIIPGIVDVGYHFLPALRSQDACVEDVDAALAQATALAASGGVTTIVDTPREALPAALALSLLGKRATLLQKCSLLYVDVGMLSRVDMRSNLEIGLLSHMRDGGCLGVAVHLSTLGTDTLSNAMLITKTAARRAHGPGGVPAASKNKPGSPLRGASSTFASPAAPSTDSSGAHVRPSRSALLLKALSQLKMAFVVDIGKVARPLGHDAAPGDTSNDCSPASVASTCIADTPSRRKAMRVAASSSAVESPSVHAVSINQDLAPRLGRLVMNDEDDEDNDSLRHGENTAADNDDSNTDTLHEDLRDLRRRHMMNSLRSSPAFKHAQNVETGHENTLSSSDNRFADTPERASVASQYSTPTRTRPAVRRVPQSTRSCGTFTMGQRGGSPSSVTSNSSLRSLRRQRRSSSFNLRSWRLDRDEFCSEESDTQASASSPSSLLASDSVHGTPSRQSSVRSSADATPTPRQTLWARRRRHNSRSMQRFQTDSPESAAGRGTEDAEDYGLHAGNQQPHRFRDALGLADDDDDDELPAGALELSDSGFFSDAAHLQQDQEREQQAQQTVASVPAGSRSGPHGLPPVGQPPSHASARRQRFASRRSLVSTTPEPGEPAHESSDAEDGVLLDEEEEAPEISYPDVTSSAARRRAFAKHASPRLSVSSFASLGSNKPSSASMPPLAPAPLGPNSTQSSSSGSGFSALPARRYSAFSSPGSARSGSSPARRAAVHHHHNHHENGVTQQSRPALLTGSLGSPQSVPGGEGSFTRATAFQPRGRLASGDLARLQHRFTARNASNGPSVEDSANVAGPRARFQSPMGPVRLTNQRRSAEEVGRCSQQDENEGVLDRDCTLADSTGAGGGGGGAASLSSSSSSSSSSWCNNSSASSATLSSAAAIVPSRSNQGRSGLLCTGGPKLNALQALVKLLASAQRTRGASAVSKVRLTLGETDALVLAEERQVVQSALRDAHVHEEGVVVSARAFGPMQHVLKDSWMGSEVEALETAIDRVTCDAAATLGLQASKGCLAPGFDADFVILQSDTSRDDFAVCKTFCRGVLVYSRAEPHASPTFPPGRLLRPEMMHPDH